MGATVVREEDYYDGNWFSVTGAPVNGAGWLYKRTRDAFYVLYMGDSGEEKIINFEPADEGTQSLIPDVESELECVEFALSLIEEDQKEFDDAWHVE